MRRAIVVVVSLLALCSLRPAAQARPIPPPKLVVILVVDQMRAEYLTRFDRHWMSGFRTLLRDGAVFDNANYPYFSTVTCAGHATIGTGAFPHSHGMLTNGWWRRDTRTTPECTADADVQSVSYGAPVQVGSSPKQLMVPTLADEIRAQKPGARVVSISLKSRGTITLAGQAADAIVWFEDAAATFATSKSYTQTPVPAVKRFIDANPYEKDFGRTWSLLAPSETYLQRDAGIGERPPTGWTAMFPHTIPVPPPPPPPGAGRTGGAPAAGRAQTAGAPAAAPAPPIGNPSALWQSTPFADAYLGRMAISLADSFELGRRATTDFLSISFSTLDDVGHAFGPDSREVEDILRHLDVTIGGVIDALDMRVGRENYVLGFSADHGVAQFAGFGRGGRVHNEDVRDRVDEVLTAQLGPLQKGSYVDANTSGHLYLAPGVFERLKASPTAMAALKTAVEAIPGVAQLLRADQLSETSRDPAVRAAFLSYVPGRGGDLLVVVDEYWSLLARATTTATHGTTYEYDTHVPVILMGGAIKPGHHRTTVTPADIAPTLAQVAGVKLAKAEGRVLVQSLR